MNKFKVGDKVLINESNKHECAGLTGIIALVDETLSRLTNQVNVIIDGFSYTYWLDEHELTLIEGTPATIANLSQLGAQC